MTDVTGTPRGPKGARPGDDKLSQSDLGSNRETRSFDNPTGGASGVSPSPTGTTTGATAGATTGAAMGTPGDITAGSYSPSTSPRGSETPRGRGGNDGAGAKLSDFAERGAHMAEEGLEDARRWADEQRETFGSYARENPTTALLGALGVGVIIGMWLAR